MPLALESDNRKERVGKQGPVPYHETPRQQEGTVVRSWSGFSISDVDAYGIKLGTYSIKVTRKSGSYIKDLR